MTTTAYDFTAAVFYGIKLDAVNAFLKDEGLQWSEIGRNLGITSRSVEQLWTYQYKSMDVFIDSSKRIPDARESYNGQIYNESLIIASLVLTKANATRLDEFLASQGIDWEAVKRRSGQPSVAMVRLEWESLYGLMKKMAGDGHGSNGPANIGKEIEAGSNEVLEGVNLEILSMEGGVRSEPELPVKGMEEDEGDAGVEEGNGAGGGIEEGSLNVVDSVTWEAIGDSVGGVLMGDFDREVLDSILRR